VAESLTLRARDIVSHQITKLQFSQQALAQIAVGEHSLLIFVIFDLSIRGVCADVLIF
jgi:hypothetical protein